MYSTETLEALLGSPQSSKMESFARIVNDFQSLTVAAKLSTLNVCGSLDYASETRNLETAFITVILHLSFIPKSVYLKISG